MRFNLTIGIIAVAVLATALPGVASAKVSESNFCVAIDVTAETEEGLVARFDSFARSARLTVDSSHPAMRVYYPAGSDVTYPTDSTVMVILRNGMGPFGSILSYYPLRGDPPPDLLDELDRFVRGEIAKAYGVRNCAEIEGFTAPVIYH